jgi:uncharacterized SAM-binding protein YcdF (DUF218 family)
MRFQLQNQSSGIWYNAPMGKNSKTRRPGCMVFLAVILIVFIIVVLMMGQLLVVADPLEKSDAIVVLSGGEAERMQEAISLYEEKYAEAIILTETGAVLQGYNATYSSEQRLILIDAGIPPTAIQVTGKHAASTREEAKLVRTLVTNTDTHSLIVVTDPYHTLRTRLIWDEVFNDSGVNIIIRPARGSWYRPETWWMTRAGWTNTLNEYAKLAVYLVTHTTD